MLRSKFRSRYLKEKTKESKSLYNKQRNICVSLLRKTKTNYYAQLNNKIVKDNRKFWKAVSRLFSEKTFPRNLLYWENMVKPLLITKK